MEPRLNILQVISQRHFSGAERVCLTLSEALQERGHRVTVLCKPGETMLAEAAKRKLTVLTPGISGKLNLLAPFRIARAARGMGADIVHTHLSTAGLWGALGARLAGIPSLAHVHALNSKHYFLAADAMVACSQGVRQHILAQRVAPERIEVVYNGLEPARFARLSPAAEVLSGLGIAEDCQVLCAVGHLAAKKGHDYLLQALARLAPRWPGLRCLILGEGEERPALEKRINELGLAGRAFLLGFRSDVIHVMNASGIVVLPSLGKEGLPLVLIEASFLGKPAVASRLPGVDEVVADGLTGFLVPPGDPAALADRIETLLADPALRRSMGDAALERARELFTVEAMVEETEALYRRMIGAHRAR